MPYLYQRYTNGPDAESHVKSFLSTWQANHLMQHLIGVEAESSKIMEFTLSFDGPTMCWYFLHILGEFAMFQDVQIVFLNFSIGRYASGNCFVQLYAITQEPNERVPQFTIRFQDLYHQIAQDVSADHLKGTFFAGLQEPLRTTLALTDLSQQMIEQVVTHVLIMDRAKNNTSFFVSSHQGSLLTNVLPIGVVQGGITVKHIKLVVV